MKFSIIVPVYNVEEYIIKCLESINNQTYDNYEVIIVNDGSPDNSETLIKKYIKNKKKFIYYKKENGGLSDARNFGVQHVNGNYMLFVDSDDYISEDLLFKLNEILSKKKYEMVKFNFVDVFGNGERKHLEPIKESKEIILEELVRFDYFEAACGYCYNTEFYKNNKFEFEKKRYHEDFGLVPMILLKSQSIYYLNHYAYYYLKREGSIINDQSKQEKKAEDVYYFSTTNIDIIKRNKEMDEEKKSTIINFYANGAINVLRKLINKQKYRQKLKDYKMYKNLAQNTLKRKIKKLICMISYDLYLKVF